VTQVLKQNLLRLSMPRFGLEDDPHILKREGVLYGVSIAFSEERGSQVLTIS
jgi:hypothetical protein